MRRRGVYLAGGRRLVSHQAARSFTSFADARSASSPTLAGELSGSSLW
jgi:hypothetical protein